MHNAAFAALGLDWVYLGIRGLAGRRRRSRSWVCGARLRRAQRDRCLTRKQSSPQSIISIRWLPPLHTVNTIVADADGLLTGYTTDGADSSIR